MDTKGNSNTAVYISDLDGTLLQPDATLSGYARDAIGKILMSDILFTVATARSVTSTREILGNLPFQLPVICSNGGSIYNYDTLKPFHLEYLPPHISREVILDIKERSDTAFVSVNVDGKEKVFYDSLPNDGMQWYHDDRVAARDKRLTFVEDLAQIIDLPITTITFMNRFFHIDKTKSFFAKNYKNLLRLNFFENKYSPGWHWLSIHSPKACKAEAIKKLVALSNLTSREIVVFGDELNDISMFRNADHAVAVSNALPSVMEHANEVIGSNCDDAVVNYILERNGLSLRMA